MQVLVKNYKPNDKGKKALAKRERERMILAMFIKEGELFRQTERKNANVKTVWGRFRGRMSRFRTE